MSKLFDPESIEGKRSMKQAYPELARIPEFDELRDEELRFVWYLANPTSPVNTRVNRTSLPEKVETALEKSQYNVSKIVLSSYEKGMFGDKLQAAIERMKKMEVGVREKAHDIIDKIFEQYYKIAKEGIRGGDVDSYINSTKVIIKELPNLIKVKEEGFGVKQETKRNNESKGQPDIKNYLLCLPLYRISADCQFVY